MAGSSWTYEESSVYQVDPDQADAYDQTFPAKEKVHQVSQDRFALYSQAILAD